MVLLRRRGVRLLQLCLLAFGLTGAAVADDLYVQGASQSLAADHRAGQVGDIVTVIILQTAEASTTVRTGSRRTTSLGGHINAGAISESADAGLNSNFDGQGQASRSERFITQMTAKVIRILPNGELEIMGTQQLKINGEATTVEVRGVIRAIDIDAGNRVPSNRIADAQINYQGKGFVSRSARPGLLQRLFSLFGLL